MRLFVGSFIFASWFLGVCAVSADVSGTVFRDFDSDGVRSALEPGVVGVQVEVFDAAGASLGTATTVQCTGSGVPLPACASATDAGHWFLAAASAGGVRVEFRVAGAFRSGVIGQDSQTTVQFLPSSAATGVDFAIHVPSQYCEANPRVALPCYESGSGVGNASPGLVSFPLLSDGVPVAYGGAAPGPRGDAQVQELGAVWGGAYQRVQQRLFVGAFTKRHVGFGDQGPGGVYVFDYSLPGVPRVASFTLEGEVPTNGGAAITLGSLPRNTANNTLPASPTAPSHDLEAYNAVGRVGYGNLAMDEDERFLWLLNLAQDALIRLDVSAASGALPGTAEQFVLTGVAGYPAPGSPQECTGGVFRPFALTIFDGRGYLGGVCNAETSRLASDLEAVVLSFDPADPSAGLQEELRFSLDFGRDALADDGGTAFPGPWNPWMRNWADTGLPVDFAAFANWIFLSQPMLSSIVFDHTGSMVLGFIDRNSQQSGRAQYSADATATGANWFGIVGGDIIKACAVAGGFVLEGAPGCAVSSTDAAPLINTDGPFGSGEHFIEDRFINLGDGTVHGETADGGVLSHPTSGLVMSTVFDPIYEPSIPAGPGFADNGTFTAGVHRYSSTGGKAGAYTVVGPATVNLGKAGNLGEPVALCAPAPIEIGNRLFFDSGANPGSQDPGELAPPAGVRLVLFDSSGTAVAETLSDALGNYSFQVDQSASADPDTSDALALLASPFGQSFHCRA